MSTVSSAGHRSCGKWLSSGGQARRRMSAIPCAIAASPPGARSGRSRGTNARRRSLYRVSWMISRARAARRHRTPVQDRKCGGLAQTGGGRWAAAFERLLPARRERDLIAELLRHAIVATGLLTRCMLFGGARVLLWPPVDPALKTRGNDAGAANFGSTQRPDPNPCSHGPWRWLRDACKRLRFGPEHVRQA